jgi:hypothetical protein
MNSKLILHSPIAINYAKFLNHHMLLGVFGNKEENKAKNYFQHNNSYLIPYRCNSINNNNNLIIGNFIYPMWNSIETVILNRETKFNYNYILGNNFTLEITPKHLKNYNIYNESDINIENMSCQKKYRMYPNKIHAFNTTLEPNSILLFPIHKDVADVLIQTKLL